MSRRPRSRSRAALAASPASRALALGAAALAVPGATDAATFTVTNLNDSGAGSLRQAIEDANGAAGADVVEFQAGLTGTIVLTSGQLEVYDSVDIQGPGSAVLTVSGNNASRVFYLYQPASTIDVAISGLTITGGSDDIGGGIVDYDQNLTLDGVVITGNAASGDGGGLWADGFSMNLHILNSTVSGNTAGDDGGGMYVEDTGGPLLIQNSVFSGNHADDDGGGIYFYDPDDDVTIRDTTISGNSAGGSGGGVYLYSPDDGNWLVTGSTISGNSAQAGGGMFLYSPDHPFLMENSTISGNQATAGVGGGIYLYDLYGGSFEIAHSTIAGNTATGDGGGAFSLSGPVVLDHVLVGDNTASADPDLATALDGNFDLSWSLVETPGTANLNDNVGNVLGQDPQLGPLANHGGATETQLPAATSPAVDAGDPAFAPPPSTDQRGFARVVGGRVDIGAVEVAPGTIQLAVSTQSVGEGAGSVTITATRSGGGDGPVSVTIATADGTAGAPADYAAVVGGTLSWGDQDTAPKVLNVTIVDDTTDEPDETFTATITNPTGGAVLGATTTDTVTILDDDLPVVPPVSVVTVPTLGDFGELVLGGLVGLAGLVALRRRRGAAATTLAVALTLGGAIAADAADGTHGAGAKSKEILTGTLQVSGGTATIALSNGQKLTVPVAELAAKDDRPGRHADRHLTAATLGTAAARPVPVVAKVKTRRDGEREIKVLLEASAADAQRVATRKTSD